MSYTGKKGDAVEILHKRYGVMLEKEKRRNRIIERVGWVICGWVLGMLTAAVIAANVG